jgi:hypothetical protein
MEQMCKKSMREEPSVAILSVEDDPRAFRQGDVQSKQWTFNDPIFVGDCMLDRGATLIVRSDGTANWIARGRSTDDDDTFSVYFLFYKANGDPTFPTGNPFFPNRPFPVQPLEMPNDNTWYDWVSGFGFPAAEFNNMVKVTGFFNC